MKKNRVVEIEKKRNLTKTIFLDLLENFREIFLKNQETRFGEVFVRMWTTIWRKPMMRYHFFSQNHFFVHKIIFFSNHFFFCFSFFCFSERGPLCLFSLCFFFFREGRVLLYFFFWIDFLIFWFSLFLWQMMMLLFFAGSLFIVFVLDSIYWMILIFEIWKTGFCVVFWGPSVEGSGPQQEIDGWIFFFFFWKNLFLFLFSPFFPKLWQPFTIPQMVPHWFWEKRGWASPVILVIILCGVGSQFAMKRKNVYSL